MHLSAGDLLNNRYRIIEVLGQGGMGAVYHAFDENLSIDVAVKENLFLSTEYGKQFQREANILASLRHPNLPHVIDYLILPNQGQYLIMDYINGEDLRQRLERVGQMNESETILIGAAICNALTYLHSRFPPIIHRDIKPGNIKITPEGNIFLVDFGLAKIMLGDQATSTGARAMTPGYSPPEQYGSASTDARSDIYSLGATLYAALTGTIPEDSLARAMRKMTLTPIQQLRPTINPSLAMAIEKALAVEPEDRFQTAEELEQALALAGNIPLSSATRITVPPPPANPVPPQKRRHSRLQSQHFSPAKTTWLIAATLLMSILVILLAVIQPFTNRIKPVDQTPVTVATTSSNTPMTTPPLVTILPTLPTPTRKPTATPTLTFTPTVLPTPSGGGEGEIAYASDQSGTMQIWMMDSEGNHKKQLTELTEGACQPVWSPDGHKIAFISPCFEKKVDYPRSHIYILNMDDNSILPAQLPSDPAGDYDPNWSPDGTRLAFTSLRNGWNANIFVYDFKTDKLTNYSAEKKIERNPAWSPDGKWIAYVRGNANTEIWIVSADLTTRERYTVESNYINSWPAWSSDTKMLYFTQYDNSQAMPRLMSLRFEDRNYWGRELRIPLDPEPPITPIVEVAPSPDMQWFTYESWPNGYNHDIYKMTINGTNRIRLTDADTFEFHASWRPAIN